MSGRLEGRVAIVAGGARGLGESVVRAFCAEGASVLAGDIRLEQAEALCRELRDGGRPARAVHLDVAREDSWVDAVAACQESFGPPTLLVNCAVLLRLERVHEESLEGWNRALAVGLTGVFLGMRAVIAPMRAAGGGSIVNISSTAAFGAAPNAASYHAVKGGVSALSRNAAVAYAKDGIRVNALVPGSMDTQLALELGSAELREFSVRNTPMGRASHPDEVATAAVFLASDDASYVTGAQMVVDGGYGAA